MQNTFIIKILAFCTIIFFAFSCEQNCEIKKPKGVKPIDWENYNDVYTVHWNYFKDCIEPCGDIGRNIKIYGWITEYSIYSGHLYLRDTSPNESGVVTVEITDEIEKEIYQTLYTPDWPKKCYVNGKLSLAKSYPTDHCCQTRPKIIVYSANDIYFE